MKPRTRLTLACFLLPAISLVAGETLKPTIAALLKRSDPSYAKALDRAMQGIPIGNGSMGTMVWSPLDEGGLAFQINRVDAWSADNVSGAGPYFRANEKTRTMNTHTDIVVILKQPLAISHSVCQKVVFEREGITYDRDVAASGNLTIPDAIDPARPGRSETAIIEHPSAGG